MIKRIKINTVSGVLFLNRVLADHRPGHISSDPDELVNPLRFGKLEELLDAIAGFLFKVSIPLFVVVIIIGAFQLITAGGNEERISKGKKTITWAVIGFVVILLAASVAALIQNFLES